MSKFIRVPGKMGCFGLRKLGETGGQGEEEEEDMDDVPPVSDSRTGAAASAAGVQAPVVVTGGPVAVVGRGRSVGSGEGEDRWKFNPKVVYRRKKR